jgi:signal transduction histidine kinase
MTDAQPEPWGEDPSLDALVGAPGAAALRAMFDRLPDAMCLLWAVRGADGAIEDFRIGYGKPAIMRLFALQATLHADATLLGMLPQMVRSGEFAAYALVCETGEPYCGADLRHVRPHARRHRRHRHRPGHLPARGRGPRRPHLGRAGGRRRQRLPLHAAVLSGAYAEPVTEPEAWGEDPHLDALLGEQGAGRFRTVFDGFPDGVGLLWAMRDDDGRIFDFEFGYGNPTIMRMFHLPRTQRGRYTLLEALPIMRDNGQFEAYARVCDTGEALSDEIAFDTPFGDGYIQGSILRRTAKLGDGLIVFVADVTSQRRMESELRGYADMVAHDLREPITGIAHLVTLLERRADEPPSSEVLALLRASTERARELIDGVLEYARAGELQRERVALDRVMSDVSADLRPALDETGAALQVGALPEVDGDPHQLRRLLQNLVGNAVKFRGEEPPRVEVSALHGSEGWVVTVRDNGVGVDPDHASRIFGMFARLNGDTEGTGIGLAVCRRVVEAHGGRIWVEPADGGGSAFRFTLPIAP